MKKILSLIFTAAITMLLLAGCVIGFNYNLYVYDHADKYSVGDMISADNVTEIEVEWVKGSVNIDTGSEFSVKETYPGTLSDNMKLHYWLDGSTLRIRFAASGVMDFNKSELEKELTVTVPEQFSLENIYAVTVSASTTVRAPSKSIKVTTVSGDINVGDCSASEIKLESVSGDISVNSTSTESIRTDTVSGDITLQGIDCSSARADSVSGNVDIKFNADISGFTAEIDTISGRIKNKFETTQKKDTYTYGDGSIKVEIDTVSGNISLDKIQG